MSKTYLVTGASRGIGLEFARVLSKRGDRVIAAVRDPAGAKTLGELGPYLRVLKVEVSDPASIAALAQSVGQEPIDVLINNAGVASRGSKQLDQLEATELAHVLMVNSIAPILVARAMLTNLRAGNRKTIVNISSQLGSIANNTGGSSYGYRASKAALNQFNRSLANELRPEGFTCLALHPGWVKTDMGGAGADITVETSVSHMIRVIDAATPAHTGAFLNYDGTPLPW